MAEFQKIKVSKLDAVRRQLDCAIRLWINDDDSVSIHTLAFAAFEIVNDLNTKKGNKDSTLLGVTEVLAKPGHVADVMQYMKKPMLFFKHANRDPHEILEFAPAVNEYVVLFAVNGLQQLGEQVTDIQHAFIVWMLLHHPNLIKKGEAAFPQFTADQIEGMRIATRHQFFDAFLKTLATNRLRT
jgi:hypothetical protein